MPFMIDMFMLNKYDADSDGGVNDGWWCQDRI